MITADLLQRVVDFIGGFPPDRLTLIYHCINMHVIFLLLLWTDKGKG